MTKLFRFWLVLLWGQVVSAAYVEWEFTLPANPAVGQVQREVFATVERPDGGKLRLPAFWKEGDVFAVRVGAYQEGNYHLSAVEEDGAVVNAGLKGDASRAASKVRQERRIMIDPNHSGQFSRDGRLFVPNGANFPWASGDPEHDYPRVLGLFSAAGLNWARIWMAHWNHLNLDWMPEHHPQVPVGEIDQEVAINWDSIVEAAEREGVALQIVLQHHGQWSDSVDSNWNINPWNAANPGGFLPKPFEFFTSHAAQRLTRAKYRYIVARWGYSDAIMAWELFNEVHNLEEFKSSPGGRTKIAAWHSEMAAYLRSLDVQHHLITTSCDDLTAELYQKMDYLQPHSYAVNMPVAARFFPDLLPGEKRPVFYGEIGDDQTTASKDEKNRGDTLLLPAWASAFGTSLIPGQTWYVERLISAGRLSELGSLGAFLRVAGHERLLECEPFSASVETDQEVDWHFLPSIWWRHATEAVVDLPADGTEPPLSHEIPAVLIGNAMGRARGFPHQVTFKTHFQKPVSFLIEVAKSAPAGGSLKVELDSKLVLDCLWDPTVQSAKGPEGPFPVDESRSFHIPVPEGDHVIRLFNRGAADWLQLKGFGFDTKRPALAAVGKRSDAVVLLWLRNRGTTPASGKVCLPKLPQGRWRILRWDPATSAPVSEVVIEHAGGDYVYQSAPVASHAPILFEKLP